LSAVLKEVLMFEVFFATIGLLAGFVFGGVELGLVCLFIGSVMGLAGGLMLRQ
jgi:hypothetical protein